MFRTRANVTLRDRIALMISGQHLGSHRAVGHQHLAMNTRTLTGEIQPFTHVQIPIHVHDVGAQLLDECPNVDRSPEPSGHVDGKPALLTTPVGCCSDDRSEECWEEDEPEVPSAGGGPAAVSLHDSVCLVLPAFGCGTPSAKSSACRVRSKSSCCAPQPAGGARPGGGGGWLFGSCKTGSGSDGPPGTAAAGGGASDAGGAEQQAQSADLAGYAELEPVRGHALASLCGGKTHQTTMHHNAPHDRCQGPHMCHPHCHVCGQMARCETVLRAVIMMMLILTTLIITTTTVSTTLLTPMMLLQEEVLYRFNEEFGLLNDGELQRPTAAIPVENSCCSCKLTRGGAAAEPTGSCHVFSFELPVRHTLQPLTRLPLPLPLAGVSMGMELGCQQNDSHPSPGSFSVSSCNATFENAHKST